MSIFTEFREFAMRGNVVDLAVGVIIGGAFGKIISSLVTDIVMPPIGLLLGGVDFKDFSVPLKYAADGTVEVAIRYGAFINVTIDFLIVASAIFLAIKLINKARRREESKPVTTPEPSKEEKLLTEIRDLLKKK